MLNDGRSIPVWKNYITGQVVCGVTPEEGLGLEKGFHAWPGWERVRCLPSSERVVIDNRGKVLPKTDILQVIAASVFKPGALTITARGRRYLIDVTYCDATRVILSRVEECF